MGMFIYQEGNCVIPEKLLPELSKRMKTLFYEGGMLNMERVSIFGHKVNLLFPLDFDDGRLVPAYNYFEEDNWGMAGYDAKRGEVWSDKVGYRQFSQVMYAAYLLAEFYSEEFTFASYEGRLGASGLVIGWLNDLFDESYTCQRIRDIWAIYELYRDYEKSPVDLRDVGLQYFDNINWKSFVVFLEIAYPNFCTDISATCDESDLITNKGVEDEEITYERMGCLMKDILSQIQKAPSRTTKEKVDLLKRVWAQEILEIDKITKDGLYFCFCVFSRWIDWRIAAKMVADEFEIDFWDLYDELKNTRIARYDAHFPKALTHEQGEFQPVGKVSTSEYLKVSDDERAFWWTEEGDVVFSEEMNEWLEELRVDFNAVLAQKGVLIKSEDVLYTLIEVLSDANKKYKKIYCFKNVFYEFVTNPGNREVQAAIILFRQLLEEFADEIPEIHELRRSDRLERFPGRMKIRRYLSVLANPELRRKVLGY